MAKPRPQVVMRDDVVRRQAEAERDAVDAAVLRVNKLLEESELPLAMPAENFLRVYCLDKTKVFNEVLRLLKEAGWNVLVDVQANDGRKKLEIK